MPRKAYTAKDVVAAVARWIKQRLTGQIVIHFNCGGITKVYENKELEPEEK